MQYILLLVSFVLLLGGAIAFTNAIEWAGHKLGLGTGAVGSILAAVATALPESLIPMVAIITGERTGQIAIGAIIGAPFLLGTLAMGLVGIAAYAFKGRREQDHRLELHRRTTKRDLIVFLVFLSMALVLGFVESKVLHVIGAIALIVAYGVYVWRSVRAGGEAHSAEELSALYVDLSKDDPPASWQVVLQVVVGLGAIIGGAHLFVTQVEHIAKGLGFPALLLALILAPLATELPEKANSFIWVRAGKDSLAVGNITGAMVFQSMIPVAIGMAFTPWQLSGFAAVAAGCALLGGLVALWTVHRSEHYPLSAIVIWLLLYVGFVGSVIVLTV